MKEYDVIIAGAGPAGSMVAYLLARQGGQVLLLEKEELPRYKTCGGGLTLKAVNAIPFEVSSTYERVAEGGILYYRGVELIRRELSTPVAYLVMRDRFDHFLVEKAREVGAEVHTGIAVEGFVEQAAGVQVYTTRGIYHGRYLVGADGAHSIIAKQSSLLSRGMSGIALEAEVSVPRHVLQAYASHAVFDFGAIPSGYGWVFPKKEHLSIGVFHARSARFPPVRAALNGFIASQRTLRQHEILLCRGHPIPMWSGQNRLHRGRVLLVGDAAHLADPFLGEGIAYAINSAHLAAQALREALIQGKERLRTYSMRVHQELGLSFRWAMWIANVVYAYPEHASFLVAKQPFLLSGLLDVLRGNLSFRGLAYRTLWRSPRLLTSLGRLKKESG